MFISSLHFVRTNLKTHLHILNIVDTIFHIIPSCSQLTVNANDDHLVPGESFLFAALELLVCVLLSYYPNIAGDLQLGPVFQIKLSNKSNTDNKKMNELGDFLMFYWFYFSTDRQTCFLYSL